ncbi:daunorubicin resistance membrane protein [Pyrococcus furiosus DSM 3638]|uniref:Daunorubicin resistance membrane protein n=1 Tax=Pyrococcus furiosus (strain ATCC 43587 / DSM 3638 / JCM 8422 / Vc1) TaxID=186497 RepID=Q8U4P4_PYRFU|nr:ABC transporter permease [Pyrococcus furiosus]AAL80160.1 daunorubicin resistance membrane protein [Pyrococcus furiosus DSM 3638]
MGRGKEFLSSFYVAMSRETKVGIDLEFWLGTMFEPLIYVLLFGPLMEKLVGGVNVGGEEISYLAFMFPGVLTLVGINQGFRGATTFIRDRFYGGLETLFTLPVSRSVLFMAKILGACIRAFVAMATLSVLVIIVEDVSLTPLSFIQSFLVNSTLVVMLSSLMIWLLSKGENPNLPVAISGIIMLPMMFLSTIFYPKEVFEGSRVMSLVVSLNPMTHASTLTRSFLYGISLPLSEVGISLAYLAALRFLGFVLGLRGFTRALER